MNDMELAEEIERRVLGSLSATPPLYFDKAEWQQIIAALRREPAGSAASPPITAESHEFTEQEQRRFDLEAAQALLPEGYVILRPPSGEMVMVPREPTEAMLKAGATAAYTGGSPLLAMYRAMLSAWEKK